jgi:hypothetical protein
VLPFAHLFVEFPMRYLYSGLCLVLASATVAAADAPQPQPIAPGGAIASAKLRSLPVASVVANPAVMQTSVVRHADGSTGLVCEQKPNPHPRPIGTNQPFPDPQQ